MIHCGPALMDDLLKSTKYYLRQGGCVFGGVYFLFVSWVKTFERFLMGFDEIFWKCRQWDTIR